MTILNQDSLLPAQMPQGRVDYWLGRYQYFRIRKKFSKTQRLKEWHRQQPPLIAFPEPRKLLRKELAKSQRIGTTTDGKHIYLFDHHRNSSVIKELGRLREVAFRAVGEGAMKTRDIDDFDRTYRHIILWDDAESDIVGAYRIGEAFRLYSEFGKKGLYTHRLFDYKQPLLDLFPNAIELGRSFIQPKYWGKRSLDYLWMGIGAYLNANPHVRYLFGAVSISNDLPELAKQEIVAFYRHYFQPEDAAQWASSTLPFACDQESALKYQGQDYKSGLTLLKARLRELDTVLPTLYKHYAELCEQQGTRFIDFNVDPQFSNCVDSLALIDLEYILPKKHKRYIQVHAHSQDNEPVRMS